MRGVIQGTEFLRVLLCCSGACLYVNNKNTGSNLSHSLARAMALFVAHTKMFLYTSFSFSY